VLHRLGVDRAVSFVLLERAWTLFSSAITIFFVAKFLAPDEQGFFTTFRNLLALRVFFELGVAYVVVQMTSHEMAHLKLENGIVVGEDRPLRRVSSLLRLMVKWYGFAAIMFCMILLPFGFWFYRQDPASSHVAWQMPWILTVATTSGIIVLSPLLAMLEGMGLVAEVAFFRFLTSFLGAWVVWLLLVVHQRLYAAPALLLPELLAGVIYILWNRRHLFVTLWRAHHPDDQISWLREIFPFQWRIAVSWLAGYMQVQLFGPILFQARGSIEAGRLGLSLNAMAAISAIGIAWVQTKAPRMGQHIARREFNELNRLFFPALIQVMVVSVVVAIALDLGVWWLYASGSSYASRVLEPLPFALLSLATVVGSIVTCQALYLRAHKEEPFVGLSVLNAIVLTGVAVWLAPRYGGNGVVIGYLLSMVLVGLIPATLLFNAKRRAWHSKAS
jgi:hypothetical protein